MDSKFYVFLFVLMSLLGSSCASKNVLVQNHVSTQYIANTQEKVWNEIEARKKIPLKSLRMLVADCTNTKNGYPYKRPFHLRMETELPIYADTLIESRYYNYFILDAFKKTLPLKAKVRVLTRKVSKEVLDSLIFADKYDVVLTARQINFEYHYNFTGINESYYKHDTGDRITGGATYDIGGMQTPFLFAGTTISSGVGPAFHFSSSSRRPPLTIDTIIYHTDWDLRWITPVGNRKDNITHLKQEGVIIDYNGLIDIVLTSAAQQAGKSLAQVFAW